MDYEPTATDVLARGRKWRQRIMLYVFIFGVIAIHIQNSKYGEL